MGSPDTLKSQCWRDHVKKPNRDECAQITPVVPGSRCSGLLSSGTKHVSRKPRDDPITVMAILWNPKLQPPYWDVSKFLDLQNSWEKRNNFRFKPVRFGVICEHNNRYNQNNQTIWRDLIQIGMPEVPQLFQHPDVWVFPTQEANMWVKKTLNPASAADWLQHHDNLSQNH